MDQHRDEQAQSLVDLGFVQIAVFLTSLLKAVEVSHEDTADAVKRNRREASDHRYFKTEPHDVADIFQCLVDCVNTVIGISSKLVRSFVEFCLVGFNKVLGCFIVSICCKRCQKVNTLSQRSIEAFQRQDAVHTVDTEEDRCISHIAGLFQNDGSRLIVNRQIDQISTGIFCSGQLGREIGSGIIGESTGIDNVQILGRSFCSELFENTGRVDIV